MRIMKGVERILFGVNCLLWGIFALDILDPGVGDCHCFDFSKDECFWEMSAYGLTAAWQKDKGRKTYYRYYTDREWGQSNYYHISLDASYLGELTCVDIITSAARRKNENK